MIFQPAERPLDLTLLVLPESSLLSVASTLDPLRAANRVSDRTAYRWRVVSPDGRPAATTCGLALPVEGAFDPEAAGAALIVVGGFQVFHHATPKLLAGVRRAAQRGAALGGIEAGAWVLGLAGLLDGRRATTHWEDLEDFATRFPRVEVLPDRYVVDGPCFTSGGASPSFDMMLQLIRSRQGYGAALDTASVFIYDEVHAGSDVQPLVSLGRLDWHEPRVAAAIRLMERHLDDPLPVAHIARRVGVTARTLETLFGRTVGTGPGAYYLDLRLNAARRLLLDARLPAAEVALRSGFSSISTFSRAFKRRFGLSPSVFRRQAQGAEPAAPTKRQGRIAR